MGSNGLVLSAGRHVKPDLVARRKRSEFWRPADQTPGIIALSLYHEPMRAAGLWLQGLSDMEGLPSFVFRPSRV